MSDFMKNRTPFICLHGDVLIKKQEDDRTCLQWVLDMGYTREQWANAVRGYVSENRVQFFTGEGYSPVSCVNSLTVGILRTYHASVYGYMPSDFFNGVTVCEPGEFWPPTKRLEWQ